MTGRPPDIEKLAAEMSAGCIALRTRVLSRTITGIYNKALAPVGLTAGQMSILAVIARRGPIAPGAVASLLNIEKSTMSRTVERMRKQGWLAARQAASGNQQQLSLLAKGRRLLEKAGPAWRKAQSEARALLGTQGTKAVSEAANAAWRRGSDV